MANKKKKYSEIPLTKFISEKTMKKINKIATSVGNRDLDKSIDMIEQLINNHHGLKTKGVGTNRLVFESEKYDDIVFKVAFDWHGKEANRREYCDRDLSKYLVYTYQISPNFTVIMQEKVNNFTKDSFKEKEHEIRKMLKKLEDVILLVDCKLSNFRNFGFRKDGSVCLLDHGDTIPLNPQSNTVNFDEEANASLRCKKVVDDTNPRKMKYCGGKLKYDRSNYEHLICKKCGQSSTLTEASHDFFGNSFIHHEDELCVPLTKDLANWITTWQSTHQQEIILNDNKNNTKGETEEMKTKSINNQECKQIRGYWVPDLSSHPDLKVRMAYRTLRGSVNASVAELLTNAGLNPTEYKVSRDDMTSEKNVTNDSASNNRSSFDHGKFNKVINYLTDLINKNFNDRIESYSIPYSVEIDGEEVNYTDILNNVYYHLIHKVENIGYVKKNDNSLYISNRKRFSEMPPVVKDDANPLANAHIEGNVVAVIVNGIECVQLGKYWVPVDFMNELVYDEDGPVDNHQIKKLLKDHGYDPKKFKIEKDRVFIDRDNVVSINGNEIVVSINGNEIAPDEEDDDFTDEDDDEIIDDDDESDVEDDKIIANDVIQNMLNDIINDGDDDEIIEDATEINSLSDFSNDEYCEIFYRILDFYNKHLPREKEEELVLTHEEFLEIFKDLPYADVIKNNLSSILKVYRDIYEGVDNENVDEDRFDNASRFSRDLVDYINEYHGGLKFKNIYIPENIEGITTFDYLTKLICGAGLYDIYETDMVCFNYNGLILTGKSHPKIKYIANLLHNVDAVQYSMEETFAIDCTCELIKNIGDVYDMSFYETDKMCENIKNDIYASSDIWNLAKLTYQTFASDKIALTDIDKVNKLVELLAMVVLTVYSASTRKLINGSYYNGPFKTCYLDKTLNKTVEFTPSPNAKLQVVKILVKNPNVNLESVQ